jgi:hypothetical protein
MPRIPEANLRACFFLFPTRGEAELGCPVGGCGAFIEIPSTSDRKLRHIYAVTNEHLFRPKEDASLALRVNLRAGGFDIKETELDQWHMSEVDDIAALYITGMKDPGFDIARASIEEFVDEKVITDYDLGTGDEVFAIGRFLDIDGSGAVNRPVMRFGNVSALNPPVTIERPAGAPSAYQDSYLVEMRSRTGFSGSLIVIYIPPMEQAGFNRRVFLQSGKWYGPWILGLHWGQLPVIGPEAQIAGKQVPLHYGSGITAVVPAERIKKFLMEDPAMIRERVAFEAVWNSRPHTQEEAVKPSPIGDENPNHREDFSRLVSAASKSKPKGDRT